MWEKLFDDEPYRVEAMGERPPLTREEFLEMEAEIKDRVRALDLGQIALEGFEL